MSPVPANLPVSPPPMPVVSAEQSIQFTLTRARSLASNRVRR